MAVKKFSPTSPARRFMTVSAFEEITKKSRKNLFWRPLREKWRKKLIW